MDGPSSALRERVTSRTDRLIDLGAPDAIAEEQFESLLVEIEDELARDIREDADYGALAIPEFSLERAEEHLAAIESWASVASYASARFYAPASPWPRSVAGWGRRAVARLRRIANMLAGLLRPVVTALNAASFSIRVGFPWGISIGLSW